jgi:hypothetical protein
MSAEARAYRSETYKGVEIRIRVRRVAISGEVAWAGSFSFFTRPLTGQYGNRIYGEVDGMFSDSEDAAEASLRVGQQAIDREIAVTVITTRTLPKAA